MRELQIDLVPERIGGSREPLGIGRRDPDQAGCALRLEGLLGLQRDSNHAKALAVQRDPVAHTQV